MKIEERLQELVLEGWQFWAEGDCLRFRAPETQTVKQTIKNLRPHKPKILQILRDHPETLDIYPLSFGQRALWLLWQVSPESFSYHGALALRIYEPVDDRRWQQIFQDLVTSHSSLRTVFPKRGNEPIQQVRRSSDFDFQAVDATNWGKEKLHKQVLVAHREPFDLENDLLTRVRLYKCAEAECVLLVTIHHILWDGWSLDLLFRELLERYQHNGQCTRLAPPEYSYKLYVQWQQQLLDSSKGEQLQEYWKQQLAGELPVLNLPTDKSRPAVQTDHGASCQFVIPTRLTDQLVAMGQSQGATLYTTLLALFQILLHRYTGQDDILIGSPATGRTRPEFESVVGFFINLLVLRCDLTAQDMTFKDFLRQVSRTVSGALAHQDFPFAKLVELVQPKRDPSRSPLFQAFFVLQNLPVTKTFSDVFEADTLNTKPVEVAGLRLEPYLLPQQEGQFELALELVNTGSCLVGSIKYNTDLFEATTIERMVGHYQTLISSVITDPEQCISQLPLLTDTEKNLLLTEWNPSFNPIPNDQCIHELFEEQVRCTPGAIAVVFRDEKLTYEQLNNRTNHLAGLLQTMGVEAETLVGICVDRSLEMVIGLLGILKAGGAYVPLDPSYPRERLAYMVTDAEISVLLTQQHLSALLPDTSAQIIVLDSSSTVTTSSTENLGVTITYSNLAYVIYTSGSTGHPKGVMVEHRQVTNFFHGMDERIGEHDSGVWLALTTISFDISVLELFWTLTRGFKVIIQADPKHFFPYSPSASGTARLKSMEFSLFYFANDDQNLSASERYKLLLEGAKFADTHGFTAVWTPERHFHEFGGVYPNPAVAGAAIATITENVQIRAGSVVLPLHDELRVAEEWAFVDNISNGRVGVSFASGWQPNDFVLAPDAYSDRKDIMAKGIETIRKLWRGEAITRKDGLGQQTEVETFPRPLQIELPMWVTAAGNPNTFRLAGEMGVNVLSHLLGHSVEELADKISIYRQAWQDNGHSGEGHVTLMLHTFIGDDSDTVQEKIREPLCRYLESSMELVLKMADGMDLSSEIDQMKPDDREALINHAFNRYFETSGLLGSPDKCHCLIDRLKEIGVNEVACLIDFGVDVQSVLSSLNLLNTLKNDANSNVSEPDADDSVVSQIHKHKVTHMQCTPSWLQMLAAAPQGLSALSSLQSLIIGGESLPLTLAKQLRQTIPGKIHNMYGPTEATIWATTYPITAIVDKVLIGKPIANTQIYILDTNLQLVPIGVPGELYIGGAALARGYLNRPEITESKFICSPFDESKILYKTGDLARYLVDGNIEFLGRMDNQVKLSGFRIELGEIETALNQHSQVHQAVALLQENQRLVAYYVPVASSGVDRVTLQAMNALDDHPQIQLPNGQTIAHLSAHQTNALYNEIVTDEIYMRHGISLEDGDCVFDVGANIGLFTLFVQHQFPNTTVYTFEPIPPTFALLQANMSAYCPGVKVFECGLSNQSESADFTFYPEMSGISGRYAEPVKDKQAAKAMILRHIDNESFSQSVRADHSLGSNQDDDHIDRFIEDRYQHKTFCCQLTTISEIIDEHGIEKIDLLKVDVEKSELLVLEGIETKDWPKIKQLAMEVDGPENLRKIKTLLEAHDFQIQVDEYIISKGDISHRIQKTNSNPNDLDIEVYMVYAIHPSKVKKKEPKSPINLPQSSNENIPGSSQELRQFLKTQLPEYMVPTNFVMLTEFPLTPNGKIDRKALATLAPAPTQEGKATVPPQTPTERAIAEIFSDVLGLQEVGIYDDFFELGGHSLLATRLITQLQTTFEIEFPLRSFFEATTVASLATLIEDILLEEIDGLSEAEAAAVLEGENGVVASTEIDIS